jgi:DNA modification methylase
VRHLVPGGSVVLNCGQDIFEPGSPARSLYGARLLIALHERLGLSPMDTIPWIDRTKAPGPTMWASRTRQQLNVGWEPIYWLTNDPKLCRSDNRRVLQPHTEQHRKLIERGGERRRTHFGDGANRLREGSFGRDTPGRIPRNFIEVPHRCPSQAQLRAAARAEGLPLHGASMPKQVARFFVDFLTEVGDLVVDPCAGSSTTADAAEEAGRRWAASEMMAEYARAGSLRRGLREAPGFSCSI